MNMTKNPDGPQLSPNYHHKPMNSFIRIFHASPDAPPVDIYANGNLIASNIMYKDLTHYIAVPPGNYNIRVYPAGQVQTPVINTNLAIPPQSTFTVAAVGKLSDISLLPIPEPYMPMETSGKSYVRFVHLSPNAPSVDITLPNGDTVFANTSFKGITDYISLNPGKYTLQVRPSGSSTVVLSLPGVSFEPNSIYTIYAVGLVGGMPPLEALVFMDGVDN